MTKKSVSLTESLYAYLISVSLREHEVLQQIRTETEDHPFSSMQIAPDQGQFMALLVQLMQARNILEIGVFTGYSSTCLALALPPEGRLTACDISKKYTDVARGYWEKAGITEKIELRVGTALETLARLCEEGRQNSYDMAFIDADKVNYDNYYEKALQLLRPGGLLLIDNVLWQGKVADATYCDEDTAAIRNLNAKIQNDTRVNISLLAIADGLTLALKR
jgi:predicted O-methyltransferase YrrM